MLILDFLILIFEKIKRIMVGLYKIAIRHDGAGHSPDWHLNQIELTMVDPRTQEQLHSIPTEFNFDKWIKANTVYECGCNNIMLSAYTVS